MSERSVMISVHPRWCGDIAELIKDLEIRKTIPKLKPPFTVYIYCTRSVATGYWIGHKGAYVAERARSVYDTCGNGRVIGRFVCDRIYRYTTRTDGLIQCDIDTDELLRRSCLSLRELIEYEAGGGIRKRMDLNRRKGLWAWQISDLQLYVKPKFLENFGLKQPPQSWGYVKEVV